MKSFKVLLISFLGGALFLVGCGGGQKTAKPVVSVVPGIPNGAVSSFNDGVALLAEKPPKYAEALREFQDAVKAHPTYRVARLNVAICLEKTGQYAEAAAMYQNLVDDYVEDASVFMAFGNALLLSGQTGQAIEQFERVVTIDDKNLEAKNNLAAAYLQKGELERSREFVKEVLAVQPDNVPALINLGMYYQRKKKMDLSRLMFETALNHELAKDKPAKGEKVVKSESQEKSNPLMMARAHNNLGMTWFMMGVIPNAVHHFKQAIGFDPSMNEARMNVASIYLDYLAYENALAEFKTVLASNPKHYEALIGTADSLYGTGAFKEAAKLFEQSFGMNKKNSEAMFRLAEIYHRKLNKPQDAMGIYRRISSEMGFEAGSKVVKKANQMISSIQVELKAAREFAEQDKKKAQAAEQGKNDAGDGNDAAGDK